MRSFLTLYPSTAEAEKISPLVWLHDGNLRFLQGKHIALVVVSTLFALFYIIALTLLLLFAPVLRRAHNHRIMRLVQRLKPLLDAFQGAYKDRFHWWPGLMLVIRIMLLIALTANTKHDPRLSALVVGVTALPLALLSYGGVYKNKLLNLHETALNTNMIVFVHVLILQLQFIWKQDPVYRATASYSLHHDHHLLCPVHGCPGLPY